MTAAAGHPPRQPDPRQPDPREADPRRPDLREAERIAAGLLAEALPRRWRHVRAVAARATAVAEIVPAADRDILIAAAWLHDIGYADPVTGFHPLDGARRLRENPRLAALVAHHTYARHEAALRGIDLAEFPREDSLTADVLAYADLTTGPDGQPMTVAERIAEIHRRYGEGHVVSRTWRIAGPEAVAMSRRVDAVWRSVGE